MTEAAIISGSLVDVRNVGTHKSVKLTIHVPEELAMKVMEAFGWPTGVSPVSVAVARLEPVSQRASPPVLPSAGDKPGRPTTTPVPPAVSVVRADKERRSFDTLPCAQQAGILCGEQAFKVFLFEKFNIIWDRVGHDPAAAVREICEVNTRAEIKPDNAMWSALVLSYRLWQREPEYVG